MRPAMKRTASNSVDISMYFVGFDIANDREGILRDKEEENQEELGASNLVIRT